MSRHAKRMRKRAARAALKEHVAQSGHLLMQGWKSPQEYQAYWRQQTNGSNEMSNKKKFKPVEHDNMLTVPYKWEVGIMSSKTGKMVKVMNRASQVKLGGPDLYSQGGTLFLVYDGSTQKLTAMHQVTVWDGETNEKHTHHPQKIVEWTEDWHNTQRKEAAARG